MAFLLCFATSGPAFRTAGCVSFPCIKQPVSLWDSFRHTDDPVGNVPRACHAYCTGKLLRPRNMPCKKTPPAHSIPYRKALSAHNIPYRKLLSQTRITRHARHRNIPANSPPYERQSPPYAAFPQAPLSGAACHDICRTPMHSMAIRLADSPFVCRCGRLSA